MILLQETSHRTLRSLDPLKSYSCQECLRYGSYKKKHLYRNYFPHFPPHLHTSNYRGRNFLPRFPPSLYTHYYLGCRALNRNCFQHSQLCFCMCLYLGRNYLPHSHSFPHTRYLHCRNRFPHFPLNFCMHHSYSGMNRFPHFPPLRHSMHVLLGRNRFPHSSS